MLKYCGNYSFVCRLAADPAVHRNRHFNAWFPVFSIVCLENRNSLPHMCIVLIDDCLFKSRLEKNFCVYLGFHWTLILPSASASEFMTMWRYQCWRQDLRTGRACSRA